MGRLRQQTVTNGLCLGIGFAAVALAPVVQAGWSGWWEERRPHGKLVVVPASYDFGRVLSRHTLRCQFTAMNEGHAAVRLLAVRPG
jgi:hypothetical protein